MSTEEEQRPTAWRDLLRRTRDAEDFEQVQRRLKMLAKPSAREANLGQIAYRSGPTETSSYTQIKQQMLRGLIETLDPQAVARASHEQVQAAVNEFIAASIAASDIPLSGAERLQLGEDLLYEILGLGPLTPLMTDPTVSDILVNGPNRVYVERKGKLELTDVHFHDEEHLMLTIERILARFGRRVDESSPMADARLADGSRVNAIIPPLAVRGPTLSIRRFSVKGYSLERLVSNGSLTPAASRFLQLAVRARLNIVISGGTGSGKTTMLNALAEHINPQERIITIEDTAELKLPHEHVVALEGRPPNSEGVGEVTIRQLVRNALRMRPDRIVVGESRGGEALDMLQAMNTGHDGSMTTIHSNSPRDTLSRLETMMLMADVDLPQRVLREQIGSAVHLIVHLARLSDGSRRVMNITEVTGCDNGTVLTQDLFITRRDDRGNVRMRGLGIRPHCAELMYQNGVAIEDDLFQP